MRRFLAASLAVALVLSVSAPVMAVPSYSASLTLDQPAPVYGQVVALTAVYPKIPQSRQPQYPNQPMVQLDCYQSGVHVWSTNGWTSNKQSLGGGWSQSVYLLTLGGAYNEFSWLSGAASCFATLYSVDVSNQFHAWASASFDVSG